MRMGVADYIMLYYWQEFNLLCFYDPPNGRIEVLTIVCSFNVTE